MSLKFLFLLTVVVLLTLAVIQVIVIRWNNK